MAGQVLFPSSCDISGRHLRMYDTDAHIDTKSPEPTTPVICHLPEQKNLWHMAQVYIWYLYQMNILYPPYDVSIIQIDFNFPASFVAKLAYLPLSFIGWSPVHLYLRNKSHIQMS